MQGPEGPEMWLLEASNTGAGSAKSAETNG